MAEICGNCLMLDWSNKEKYSSKDKYWCKEQRRYVESTDRSCRYYSYDKSSNKNNSNSGYTSTGCSFSTIVRDILGYADNCELLNLLREFRENILKQNLQFLPILLEYDQISPLINEKIKVDENNYKFSLEFVQKFLSPFAIEFKNGNTENALLIYQNMFSYLKTTFGFDNITIDLNASYDLETLGKGRIRKLNTSEI